MVSWVFGLLAVSFPPFPFVEPRFSPYFISRSGKYDDIILAVPSPLCNPWRSGIMKGIEKMGEVVNLRARLNSKKSF
jgi:hypothetical protein